MAILLAELSAEIGADNVGVFQLAAVHRPEAKTQLVALQAAENVSLAPSGWAGKRRTGSAQDGWGSQLPSRLLPRPVALKEMPMCGSTIIVGHQMFTVQGLSRRERLDQVEWWTSTPLSRDYMRAWLVGDRKSCEAWIYTDRFTGEAFLHGFYD